MNKKKRLDSAHGAARAEERISVVRQVSASSAAKVCWVAISAQRRDGRLELIVSDDGPGLTTLSTAGIGLSNARARLAQLYGDAGGMTLESSEHGVRAIVQIPFRECAES